MKNMIRADIRRIMCKKSFWVVFAIAILTDIALVMFHLYSKKYSSFSFMTGNTSAICNFCGMLIGIAVFLAVYADDFKSMTLISVIGRGNSRLRIILAKFINSVIITVVLFAIMALNIFILSKAMGISMLPDERLCVILVIIYGTYVTIAIVTIGAIVIYASSNIPFSLFMIVMLYFVIPVALRFSSTVSFLEGLHLERYDMNGLALSGFSDIILGMVPSGIATLIGTFVIYVGGALAIIYAVFRKRELDF